MKTELEKIARKTGAKPCECKCVTCKKQCESPGLITPREAEKLISAGHADKLAKTIWLAGQRMGVTNEPIEMIAPLVENGLCAFHKDGLCSLHNTGLKPIECQLAHHSVRATNLDANKSISWQVAKFWLAEPQQFKRLSAKLDERSGFMERMLNLIDELNNNLKL